MHWRDVYRVALPVVMALAVAGSPALAGDQAPSVPVVFTRGPDSPFAGTRFDGQYVFTSKRVYFLGFRTLNDQTDGSIWYYDTVAETYTDTGVDMPVPVSNYGIAALNDANGLGLYIFGGRDAAGAIVDTTQVYYPASNATAVIASDPFPGRTPSGCISLPAMGVATGGLGSLSTNRAVVLGGASFSASGCVDDNSAQTWLFDPNAAPGARWTQGPDLNLARGYITPGVLKNTIYAIGGDTNEAGTLIPQSIVESWTVGSGGWDDAGVADLPQPCDESQAFGFTQGELANTITLAGCGQWPSAVPDVLQFSASANSWSNVGTLNDNRRNHAGAVFGSAAEPKLYILGGFGEASGFIDPIFTSEIGEPGTASAERGPAVPAGPAGGVATN